MTVISDKEACRILAKQLVHILKHKTTTFALRSKVTIYVHTTESDEFPDEDGCCDVYYCKDNANIYQESVSTEDTANSAEFPEEKMKWK